MRNSLRSTAVLWRGPSAFDDTQIRVVISGMLNPSKNSATGPMAQIWFMPDYMNPFSAVMTAADVSVCDDCELRPAMRNWRPEGLRPCYVNTAKAPRNLWIFTSQLASDSDPVRTIKSSRYSIRWGAYGDPASMSDTNLLIDMLKARPDRTGYTRQWRTRPDLAGLLCASVFSEAERREAKALGFQTFRQTTMPKGKGMVKGERPCPKQWGRVQCVRCNGCNGTGRDWLIETHK